MRRVAKWADSPELLAFYENHRNRPEDLYPSEARFIPWLAERATSVLDVGCAAGGFRTIWGSYAPAVRYEGVDLSPAFVEAARRLHPDATFHLADAVSGIPLPDRHADVVQALGWLHWVEEWEVALQELWRLAARYVFFDVRVGERDEVRGRQRVERAGAWDGETVTPYVVVAWPSLAATIEALRPVCVRAFGYCGSPAESAEGVPDTICFATFVLERGAGRGVPVLDLDLPFTWPTTTIT